MTSKQKTIWFIIWSVLFGACYCYLKVRFGFIFLDDAYITMSHARTWVEQGVPVMSRYNPVNGTSTPFFTLLVALLALMFGTGARRMEVEVYGLNAACDILILALIYRISRVLGLKLPLSLLAVSACGLSLNFFVLSASGMETMVYVIVILAGIYGVLSKNPHHLWKLGPAFLAPLTRPEGVLLSVVVCLGRYVRKRKLSDCIAPALAGAAGFAAFITFYVLSYGHPLPHSVVAKGAQVHYPISVALSAWVHNAFLKGPVVGGERLLITFNTAVLLLAAIGIGTNASRWKTMLLLAIWPILYMAFFIITRASDPAPYWYYFPVVPVFILMCCFGIDGLLNKYDITVWVLLFLFIIAAVRGTVTQHLPEKYRLAYQDREGRYKKIMAFMAREAREGEQIYNNDVGVLGFFGKQRILDYHGLISSEVIPFIRTTRMGKNYYDTLISVFGPEWILTRRPHTRLVRDTITQGISPCYNYRHMMQFEGSILCDILDVWRKMDK